MTKEVGTSVGEGSQSQRRDPLESRVPATPSRPHSQNDNQKCDA